MKEQWNEFLEIYINPIVNDPRFILYVAILGIIIVVAAIVLTVLRRLGRSIRVFDNQAGHVDVSNRALYELVNSACNKVGCVHKPRVRFKTSRTKLHIVVKFKLEEGTPLSDISAVLQNQIKRTLQETLSIEKTILINPLVTGFIQKSKTGASSTVTPTVISQEEPKGLKEPEKAETIIPPAPSKDRKSEQAETADWSLYKAPSRQKTESESDSELTDRPADLAFKKPADPISDAEDETPEESATKAEKKKRSFFSFGSKKKSSDEEEDPLSSQEKESDKADFDDFGDIASSSDTQDDENPKSI